jgi:streptogramin lyase
MKASSKLIKKFNIILILLLLALPAGAQADLSAAESELNPAGNVYELNRDGEGVLWISDNLAGEIWAIDPGDGSYTVYGGLGAVSDARRNGQGRVYWVDGEAGLLGQLDLEQETARTWQVAQAASLVGTAIDASGRIWFSDRSAPQVLRFDPGTRQLCRYAFPGESGGGSEYLLAAGENIWLSDWFSDRLLRLEPTAGQFTVWAFPTVFDIDPVGIALDRAGNPWWGDPDRYFLGRLEPGMDRFTRFNIPGGPAYMIAMQGLYPWHTDNINGRICLLEPGMAASSTVDMDRTTSPITPNCTNLGSGTPLEVTIATGEMSTQAATYSQVVDSGGWSIFELPEDAYPWGITYRDKTLWLVDNGRQVLSQMTVAVDVEGCKVMDNDGELSTAGDQDPVQGWRIYLVIDGQRQVPALKTDKSGCVSWLDLPAVHAYGLEESSKPGWEHLNEKEHDFGQVIAGESYAHTFINFQLPGSLSIPLIFK